jgi:hypothetical protein
MLVMVLSSHTSDSAAKVNWLQRDVDVESCWRRCYQVMLAKTLQLKVVLVVVRLCSPRAQSI